MRDSGGERGPPRLSIRDLSLDELRQKRERLLPAEIACLWRDGLRQARLHDAQFRSAGNALQGDRRLHLPGQVRILEPVGVANALVWRQLTIFAPEGVTAAGAEIRERHPVAAPHLG